MKSFLSYKIERLKNLVEAEGILVAFKKILLFLPESLLELLNNNALFLKITYGFILPQLFKLFPFIGAKVFKAPQTKLMKEAREFWFENGRDIFSLNSHQINKKEMFLHGGPSLQFSCDICQQSEWLSRVKQKNLFTSHSSCLTTEECEVLCQRQGNDLWKHYHQNFDFALGVDDALPTPKGIYVLFGPISQFFALRLEPMERVLRWQLALNCQLDLATFPLGIDWSKYDFVFMYLPGVIPKFKRPSIPIILFTHDFWREPEASQWVFDWLGPDVILTSCPAQWKENFRIGERSKVVFHPMFASNFFTRPSLSKKSIDLLVIGNAIGPLYKGRVMLGKQIKKFQTQYPNFNIEFSQITGTFSPDPEKGLEYKDSQGNKIRYLNKWSEYLGSAKYVVFGRMKYPALVGKYYETLGSGAIPIFPEVPDLKLLGVKAFEHYIPLSEIDGNNERLNYFLDNYEKFKYIAENAVKWYKENSDKMLFENFENMVREITNYKFSKRLL